MKTITILTIIMLTSVNLIADEIPLRIAVIQEFGQFNPITNNLASTESFMHFVLREMTVNDSNGKLIPDLAEQIPSFENKGATEVTEQTVKKIKATWHIKKTATWSDGKPVTCQDWWLGWQAGLSNNTSVEDKGKYSKIEKIEWTASEPRKCVVTYANVNWTFDRELPFPIPYSIENSIFTKWKDQKSAYDQNSAFVTTPERLGLYNGPYQVQEFKLGSHIVLVPNPHFYGEKTKIQKILVKHIGESNAILANIQSGAINMVSPVGFPPDLALSFAETEAKESFKVFFRDSPVFQGIFF